MKNLKISVVVPVFNSEKYLEKCIDSIINQTYKNIEIILINDGSSDKSEEICNSYLKTYKNIKLINQSNSGVSVARNNGLKSSTGDYVLFVDSDDWLEKDMLEIMVKEIDNFDIDIVRCEYFVENNPVLEDKYFKKIYFKNVEIKNNNYLIENITNYNINPAVWMMLIKRELAVKHKFTSNIGYGEDLIYSLDLLLDSKKIKIIPYAFYHYRLSDNSASRNPAKYTRNIENLIKLHSYIKEILTKNGINNNRIDKNSIKSYYYLIIWYEYLKFNASALDENSFIEELKKIRNSNEYVVCLKKYGKNCNLKLNRKLIIWFFDNEFYFMILFTLKLKKYLKGGGRH